VTDILDEPAVLIVMIEVGAAHTKLYSGHFYRIFVTLKTTNFTFTSTLKMEAGNSSTMRVATHQMVKGKSVPLQAWIGPEGSRELRFPDFMTTVQDGGKVVSLTYRPPLPAGNAPGTQIC
jgi:hypothetical protein